MKLKTFLIVVAVLTLIDGLEALFVPSMYVASFGSDTNIQGLLGFRAHGVANIAIAILFWTTRNLTSWESLRPTILFGFLLFILGALLNIYAGISMEVDLIVWVAAALNAVFAAVFGYYLFWKKSA